MSQPSLFESPLVCAFGEPWEGDHPLCRAEVERACQRFEDAIERGEYNAKGFTVKELRALEKRQR